MLAEHSKIDVGALHDMPLRIFDAERQLLQRSEREFLRVLIHAAKHLRDKRRNRVGLDSRRRIARDEQPIAKNEQRARHSGQAGSVRHNFLRA